MKLKNYLPDWKYIPMLVCLTVGCGNKTSNEEHSITRNQRNEVINEVIYDIEKVAEDYKTPQYIAAIDTDGDRKTIEELVISKHRFFPARIETLYDTLTTKYFVVKGIDPKTQSFKGVKEHVLSAEEQKAYNCIAERIYH